MKSRKASAPHGGSRGMTLIEMLVASTIMIVVIVQISAIGLSFSKYFRNIKARIELAQEAQSARALMVADWQRGVNAAPGGGGILALEFPADSASSAMEDGVLHYSHVVTYALSGTNLIREDNGATSPATTPWQMTMAMHLDHVVSNYASASLVSSAYVFKKGGLERDLNVLMVNCGPLQGQVDCSMLLPMMPYYPFLPIDSNVVYSSITTTLNNG
jgi:prepilin-type N-terminal cleavage/methylation domain-containing protein